MSCIYHVMRGRTGRRGDVTARLVELDPRNTAVARRLAAETGLGNLEIVTGDWARGAPDLVPQVCAWFEERGFDRVWVSDPQHGQCCGAHRFTGAPAPVEEVASMFEFTGHDLRAGPDRL